MPYAALMKEATEVLIAEVCELGSETESLRSVEDVAVHLRRHGVSVGANAFLRGEHSVADELPASPKMEMPTSSSPALAGTAD